MSITINLLVYLIRELKLGGLAIDDAWAGVMVVHGVIDKSAYILGVLASS